ncbi:MAG TPA: hypothetical protein VKZ83_06025 [Phototrophicaceae bacterium]|nr:hypothetical protein [Phototrophicaceae bacterium]
MTEWFAMQTNWSDDDSDMAADEPAADALPPGTDPEVLLTLIAAERERTRRRTAPSLAVIATAWGVAWLLGYLTLFLTFDGVTAPWWAFTVFSGLLAVAVVVTAVHTARRSAGLRGESARVGALYGWTWIVGFAAAALVFVAVARLDASPEVVAVLSNGVSCLVVGLVYMAGGMLWRERSMYLLGGWIALAAGAASLAGTPTIYLVMALAGGGGFVVAAVLDAVAAGRRRAS